MPRTAPLLDALHQYGTPEEDRPWDEVHLFRMPDHVVRGSLLSAIAGFARHKVHIAMEHPCGSWFPHEASIWCLCDLDKLLEEPLQSEKLAQAYNGVRASVQLLRDSKGSRSKAMKLASRVVRDLLVLHCCLGQGPLDVSRFEHLMSEAFGQPLDADLAAEFSHTYGQVLDLGHTQNNLEERVNRAFGEALAADVSAAFVIAYRTCAEETPKYVSNAKAARAGRPLRPSKRKRQEADRLTAGSPS